MVHFLCSGRSKIKGVPAGPATSTTRTTTTTNVLVENDENSGQNGSEEPKAPPKNHTLDDEDAKSVVAMELCDSVQRHFAALPLVDLVWCFWNFRV